MVFAFPSGLNPEIFPLAWLVGEWEGEGQVSYHEQVPTARAWNHIKFSHNGGPYLKYESTIRLLGAGEAALPGAVLPTEGMNTPEVQDLVARYSSGTAAQPFEVNAAHNVEVKGVLLPDGIEGDPLSSAPEAIGRLETTEPDGVSTSDAATSSLAGHEGEVWSTETGYWRVHPMPHPSGKGNEFYLDVFIVDAGGRMTFFNGEAKPARIELASAKVVRAAPAAEVDGSKRMYGYINDHLAWAEDLVAFNHDLSSYASFFLQRTVDGDGNSLEP